MLCVCVFRVHVCLFLRGCTLDRAAYLYRALTDHHSTPVLSEEGGPRRRLVGHIQPPMCVCVFCVFFLVRTWVHLTIFCALSAAKDSECVASCEKAFVTVSANTVVATGFKARGHLTHTYARVPLPHATQSTPTTLVAKERDVCPGLSLALTFTCVFEF